MFHPNQPYIYEIVAKLGVVVLSWHVLMADRAMEIRLCPYSFEERSEQTLA